MTGAVKFSAQPCRDLRTCDSLDPRPSALHPVHVYVYVCGVFDRADHANVDSDCILILMHCARVHGVRCKSAFQNFPGKATVLSEQSPILLLLYLIYTPIQMQCEKWRKKKEKEST